MSSDKAFDEIEAKVVHPLVSAETALKAAKMAAMLCGPEDDVWVLDAARVIDCIHANHRVVKREVEESWDLDVGHMEAGRVGQAVGLSRGMVAVELVQEVLFEVRNCQTWLLLVLVHVEAVVLHHVGVQLVSVRHVQSHGLLPTEVVAHAHAVVPHVVDCLPVLHGWMTAEGSCELAVSLVDSDHLGQHVAADRVAASEQLSLGRGTLTVLAVDILNDLSDIRIPTRYDSQMRGQSADALLPSWSNTDHMEAMLDGHSSHSLHVELA